MIRIERTTESGYLEKEYEISEAISVLNLEIENDRTIWIDGRPHTGDIVTQEDIVNSKNVCVTNKLVGG
jgi:hypothetical protein